MHEQLPSQSDGLSRRNLIVGAGALAGATAAATAFAGSAIAAVPEAGPVRPLPEALAPIKPFLTYVGIDALAFLTNTPDSSVDGRYYEELTGTGALTPPDRLSASLFIPAGSLIYQLNVAYQGQPILEIFRRQLATPNPPLVPFQLTLAAGPMAKTQTIDLVTPIRVEVDSTYSVQYYTSPGASVYGVTIGFLPPTQSFIPFVGTPRILDTRVVGGKLAPNEERVVALGFPGARGAVLNVTATETEAAGFIAVNPSGLAYPGNSSVNWTTAGENVANGVITAIDAAGQITIRGGANRTHVVIDRIGWLI